MPASKSLNSDGHCDGKSKRAALAMSRATCTAICRQLKPSTSSTQLVMFCIYAYCQKAPPDATGSTGNFAGNISKKWKKQSANAKAPCCLHQHSSRTAVHDVTHCCMP